MKNIKRPTSLFIISLLLSAACPSWAIVEEPTPGAGTATTPTPETATAQWDEIKTSTFDQREKYFAGLKKLSAIVDAQVDDLQAKRRMLANRSETVDWDLAIKEFLTTRDYFKSLSRDATKATVNDWDQTKEKVTQAWTQAQSAYDKARLSTPK
ncbi:MAG: hypothetical protein QM715_03220 [Nibricoccus sp.]